MAVVRPHDTLGRNTSAASSSQQFAAVSSQGKSRRVWAEVKSGGLAIYTIRVALPEPLYFLRLRDCEAKLTSLLGPGGYVKHGW
jgi:hypothetical protein